MYSVLSNRIAATCWRLAPRFSACVKAQAKLRSGATDSPRTACKALSKTHAEGQKGTPFSLCVAAGAKLLKDQKAKNS